MTTNPWPELEERIVSELRDNGPVESRAGQATNMLADYVGLGDSPHRRRVVWLNLRSLERAGVIRRDVRGGRTYRIEVTTR